jgi:hypothetical protein
MSVLFTDVQDVWPQMAHKSGRKVQIRPSAPARASATVFKSAGASTIDVLISCAVGQPST